ncbi:MAG TPA: SDR family NAD(P)-dependent oxidoreductase [Longimicrobiales bacterium]|nr:SDR family NAD(P)-dependent oxidoreductase [Longimicrobiales bacterium]
MNRIRDQVVLITGATSGIGEACARRFAREGAHLVLWARRVDRLKRLADELTEAHGVTVRMRQLDVRDRDDVAAAARELRDDGVTPAVLVNNAGLAAGLAPFHESDPTDWDRMIDTNVKGLLNVTHAILPLMIAADRGHVINIGSTAGHLAYPKGNVYAATKYAVRALTEGMNLDAAGTPVRISSVDPGFVETEFSLVRFSGDEDRARQVYAGFQPLSGDDVADAVFYVANLPEHANILNLVLVPRAQRNVYVVDREQPS